MGPKGRGINSRGSETGETRSKSGQRSPSKRKPTQKTAKLPSNVGRLRICSKKSSSAHIAGLLCSPRFRTQAPSLSQKPSDRSQPPKPSDPNAGGSKRGRGLRVSFDRLKRIPNSSIDRPAATGATKALLFGFHGVGFSVSGLRLGLLKLLAVARSLEFAQNLELQASPGFPTKNS